MNNDASPSSSSRTRLFWDDNDGTAQTPSSDGPSSAQTPLSQSQSRTQPRRQRRARRKKRLTLCLGQRKKLVFLSHLLKSLDLVVFTELSVLYYMECSMLRFLPRALVQIAFLSPKEEPLPTEWSAPFCYLFLVLIPNSMCIALHLLTALPVGRKEHRGYQHGGLVVDFIGQLPSTSRSYYLLADIFLLILQCIMLAVHHDRDQIFAALREPQPQAIDPSPPVSAGRTLRELDEEERAIPNLVMDEAGERSADIEMRLLNHNSELNEAGSSNSSRTRENDDNDTTHPYDVFNSGNSVLGSYNILYEFRLALFSIPRMASHSLPNLGYNATLEAILTNTQRRAGADLPVPA